MPNYEQPEFVEQRVRYFDKQILSDQDYIDDQKYHIDRVRRLSRVVTAPGISQGLTLTAAPKVVTVEPGTAIDSKGRHIVLGDAESVSLNNFSNQTVTLVISYSEEESTPTNETIGKFKANKRWSEIPKLQVIAANQTIPEDAIPLAKLTLDANGVFTIDDPALSVRQYSGLALPNASEPIAILRSAGTGSPNDSAIFSGSLEITKTLQVDGRLSGSSATFSENLTATQSINTANATVSNNINTKTIEVNNSLKADTITSLKANAITVAADINTPRNINFGNQTRQMLTLWNPEYGIGIQSATQYFRTAKNFAWYKGGSHHDGELNAGGGTAQMVLQDGSLGIGTTSNLDTYRLNVEGNTRLGGSTSIARSAIPEATNEFHLELFSPSNDVGNYTKIRFHQGAQYWAWFGYHGLAQNSTGEFVCWNLNTGREANFRAGTSTFNGDVSVANLRAATGTFSGDINAGNSALYFTQPNHNHSAIGNAAGYAAIENSSDFGALMILGRAGTARGRYVRLWDFLQVNGSMEVTDRIRIDAGDGEYWEIYPEKWDKPDKDLFFDFSGNSSNWASGWLEPYGSGWKNNSDERLKKDVKPLNNVLDRVMQLKPKSYHWIAAPETQSRSFGFIAQEVEQVFPEFVSEKRGYKALNYNDFAVVAIAALQEQQRLIAQLQAEVATLKMAAVM